MNKSRITGLVNGYPNITKVVESEEQLNRKRVSTRKLKFFVLMKISISRIPIVKDTMAISANNKNSPMSSTRSIANIPMVIPIMEPILISGDLILEKNFILTIVF